MTGAAAAVRSTSSSNKLLVGYVAVDATFDLDVAMTGCVPQLPDSLVPWLARVADLPTKTSGKIDRDALPWPLSPDSPGSPSRWPARQAGSRRCGVTSSGRRPRRATTSSTWAVAASAAQAVARLRGGFPR